MKRARVYIDGFNLYYRALKGTPFRWLDLAAFSRAIAPRYEIDRIRYFTANALPKPGQQVSLDQQTYLRALQTIPCLDVHFGTFLLKETKGDLLDPVTGKPTGQIVRVRTPEEKGSDVNLATYLLADAFDQRCDAAFVVSGDSDLAEPVKLVRDDIGLPVYVVNPHPTRRSFQLANAATRYYQLFKRSVRDSQFPPTLTDAQGTITKPPTW